MKISVESELDRLFGTLETSPFKFRDTARGHTNLYPVIQNLPNPTPEGERIKAAFRTTPVLKETE